MTAIDPQQLFVNPRFLSPKVLQIRRLPTFTCVFLVAMVLSACGDWPPHGQGLSKYVSERAPEIEKLVLEFKNSDFGRINCQTCFADKPLSDWDSVSYKIVDGMWKRTENPRNREYAKMFKNAGVMSISRRSTSDIELGIAAQSDHRDRRYVIQLFWDPSHMSSTIKECSDDFEDIDCGWCKVSIDDSFWIRYQWYPEDIDPELTQAGVSGEISWEEWQKRSRAADDACLKAGLLEQGYDLDAN